MKKTAIYLLCILVVLFTNNVFAANQWRKGTGENTILGSEAGADIDTVSFQNIVDPLDRALSNHRQGCKIKYLSASTLTVDAGEVTVSNSAGTIRLLQQNTSSTTVTWANIDTGTEASSTRYYIYAYQDTVTTATFSIAISLSSSAPTGITYYRKLGSFYNNSSGDIEQISNDDNTGNLFLQVEGVTSAPTTTSASYVDLTDMSITTTTGANPVLVLFSGVFTSSSIGDETSIILDIDGTDKTNSEKIIEHAAIGYEKEATILWIENMTAGSHTFKIHWKVQGGTATSPTTLRTLQVIELK